MISEHDLCGTKRGQLAITVESPVLV